MPGPSPGNPPYNSLIYAGAMTDSVATQLIAPDNSNTFSVVSFLPPSGFGGVALPSRLPTTNKTPQYWFADRNGDGLSDAIRIDFNWLVGDFHRWPYQPSLCENRSAGAFGCESQPLANPAFALTYSSYVRPFDYDQDGELRLGRPGLKIDYESHCQRDGADGPNE